MATVRITRTAQLIADLEIAIKWMKSIGVRVGSGRLTTYLKIAEEWDSFVSGQGKLTVPVLYPRVATFAYEVPAFISIYRAFNDFQSGELVNLIKQLNKAATGPVRIEDETTTSPNPARDFLFEAFTAAYLHRPKSGCASILDSSSDTGFTHGRYRYHIECKRLSSENGIDANIKTACSQLVNALNSRAGVRQRGLVALDASKLIRPPSQLLQTTSNDDMEGAANRLLYSFINRHLKTIQRRLKAGDRRIIGVMVFFTTVAVADEDQIFVNVGRWSIVCRNHISMADFRFLGELPKLMSGQ